MSKKKQEAKKKAKEKPAKFARTIDVGAQPIVGHFGGIKVSAAPTGISIGGGSYSLLCWDTPSNVVPYDKVDDFIKYLGEFYATVKAVRGVK